MSREQLAARLASGRWRRAGLAVVLQNGPLSPAQQRVVARIHAGPEAVLTAFTALEMRGLRGWERPEVHVLAPSGTRLRVGSPVPVRLHTVATDRPRAIAPDGVDAVPAAALRAAGTFSGPRPGCGLLAAIVQQNLADVSALRAALEHAPKQRHRRALLLAVRDIAGGSDALSEIDFVRLCRRHRIPPPVQQRRRREPNGRYRYLDASWRRRDGRLVVVEVDGGLHLQVRRWWADQERQNELVLADALALRYPSVVVREGAPVVADQLRRALLI